MSDNALGLPKEEWDKPEGLDQPIGPGRAMFGGYLAHTPGWYYSPFWPVARNEQTGEHAWAVPDMVRSFLRGGIDLLDAPSTGTFTPEATSTLSTLAGSNLLARPGGRLLTAAGPAPGEGNILAYHGSPHSFDRFDISKIGTGEGAQAYGHGLYFADAEDVARSYRDTLAAKMNQRPVTVNTGGPFGTVEMLEPDPTRPGSMYQVNIAASPEHMLDWDKPLSEQSQHVQDAIANDQRLPAFHPGATGREIWQDTHGSIGKYDVPEGSSRAEEAARRLQSAGIPGIRYLDASSRTGGEGTRNTVVFNDSLISILKKYGIAGLFLGGGAAGAASGGGQSTE